MSEGPNPFDTLDEESKAPSRHRPYRPPVGVPIKEQKKAGGAVASVLLHLFIVLLLIFPFFGSDLIAEMMGAGGPGPAGGGGGGSGGTGGGRTVQERVQYVLPAPPPQVAPDPTRLQIEQVKPPEEKPPEVVVPPPIQVKAPEPTPVPVATASELPSDLPLSDAASKTAGAGGGAGNDGGTGSGSGSGGGIGSGIGTGRGSGVGPGTGGGSGRIYPPTPSELFIPPIPVPDKVKGKTITIVFDVDSTGRVIDFELTPTRDAGYNKKLRDILGATRFRPATDANGRPVRAKYNLDYTF